MSEMKPKHALSAYNLYFQLERKRILDGTDSLGLPITIEDLKQVSDEHKKKGKRVHRKTHGKIGFRELARTVANRWKKLDEDTRRVLDQQALEERNEHVKLSKEWLKMKNMETARQQAGINSGLGAATCSFTSTQSWPPCLDLSLQSRLSQCLQEEEEIQGLLALQNLHGQIMAQIGALSGIINHRHTMQHDHILASLPALRTAVAATTLGYQQTGGQLSYSSTNSPATAYSNSVLSPLFDSSSLTREVRDDFTQSHVGDCASSRLPFLHAQSHPMGTSTPPPELLPTIVPNDWLEEQEDPFYRSSSAVSTAAATFSVHNVVHPHNEIMDALPISECTNKNRLHSSPRHFNLFPLNSLNVDFIEPDEMDALF
ncbi:hypothetical protein ACA910_011695 [Epithemia clementina (nom. ined.)]